MDPKAKTQVQNQDSILHEFKDSDSSEFLAPKFVSLLIIVMILGIGTGFMLSRASTQGGIQNIAKLGGSSSVGKGTTEGSNDTKFFKDTVEGILEEGGIDGEGQYHLVRPGGDSQNVYLTSSAVDLSKFVKRKIKVWGQTQKAQKAGWLMDVGRVEVLE